MKHLLVVVIGLASITSAVAGISAKSRLAIETRSTNYFRMIADGIVGTPLADECKPSTQACIVYVAGAYATSEERAKSAKACVGNYGDTCAKYAAGAYATYAERVAAANACRNNLTIDCAKFVAGSYATTAERLVSVAACANADLECVKYVAGAYATHAEQIAAAKSCGTPE